MSMDIESIDLTCFPIIDFRYNFGSILQYIEDKLFNIRKNDVVNIYIPLNLYYPRVFLDTKSIIHIIMVIFIILFFT